MIEQEHLGLVRRDEQGRREGGRAEDDRHVAGLEAAHGADERSVRLEAPVGRRALGCAQGAMLLAPARKRRQPQAPDDDAVDVLEQQDFGEEVLPGGALLELPDGFVADLHELLARERILVLLDALEQEFLILLLERPRRPPCDAGAGVPGEAQHGSTCTVTSWSRRSRLRRSSTSSAIAWADSTSAWRSTAMVTSA